MIRRIIEYIQRIRGLQKINFALSRGAAASAQRNIKPSIPSSWEFSGFSQNGEDGIINYLLGRSKSRERYFIEIGTADGLENNSSWLSLVNRYSGLCIEGDPQLSKRHSNLFVPLNYGVKYLNCFVTKESINAITKQARTKTPDLFSVDIDGNDYYIVSEILAAGFRPRVFVVEYNSAFGPNKSCTIPYRDQFRVGKSAEERLYYGCSVAAWKSLFQLYNYQFVTVDQNGVNSIFANRDEFDTDFLDSLQGTDFAENNSQLRIHNCDWEQQFKLICTRNLCEV